MIRFDLKEIIVDLLNLFVLLFAYLAVSAVTISEMRAVRCCIFLLYFFALHFERVPACQCVCAVSYTHLRAHETCTNLVCRLLL